MHYKDIYVCVHVMQCLPSISYVLCVLSIVGKEKFNRILYVFGLRKIDFSYIFKLFIFECVASLFPKYMVAA